MEQYNDPITCSFPPEIAGRIFENYVDLYKTPIESYDPDSELTVTPRVALTLSAVCREWRAIAWSSHRLWTSLSINLLSAGHAHGPDLVRQWLERTGSLPVSVRIRQDSRRSKLKVLRGQVEADAKSVMRILDSFSAKIISLDLRGVPLNITSLLTTPSTGSVLQILRVGEYKDEEVMMEDTDIQLFRGVGTKHSPATLFMTWPLPPSRLNIQWSNLIAFTLESGSWEMVFEAIRLSAPRLEYLTLEGIDDDWRPPRPIELPKLVSLSYTEMSLWQGTSAVLFDNLRVPSLATLEYFGYEENDCMPIQEIVECLKRSACNITKLGVHDATFHDFSDLLLLLRKTITLESLDLTLHSAYSIEPLLQWLQCVPDQPLFLPSLHTLTLSVYKRFEWMSFAKIWLVEGSFDSEGQYVEEGFTLHKERMGLKACMTLRDALGKVEFLTPPVLLAFMKIKTSVRDSVKIRQQEERDAYAHNVIDLIGESRKHYNSV